MRILIAEDSAVFRRGLVDVLAGWGYEVVTTCDGDEAWRALRASDAPRLAVLDWEMPGMSGPEVCRKVRQLEDSSNYIYIILLTSYEKRKHLSAGLAAGADDYITKPFDPEELSARLRAAIRILNLQTELAELNKSLEARVSARTAEVERLLEQKDQFVNQLGHDLKTPLTPLLALLPKVASRTQDPKCLEILELLTDNVSYMRNLVERTLQLAQLNSGSTELTTDRMDLLTEGRNILAGLHEDLQAGDITVVNNITQSTWIEGDGVYLRELFHNILSNSIKYTNGPGTVTIDVSRADGMVTVTISDTGIGMTEEQLAHVFEEFYKADPSRHDRASVGLGLSICKRILEKQGGKIWADSRGPGQGTAFHFTLRSADAPRLQESGAPVARPGGAERNEDTTEG